MQSLSNSLVSYNYVCTPILITKLMQELVSEKAIDDSDPNTSYNSKIEYANDLRRKYNTNDILAAVTISAIQKSRRDFVDADAKEVGMSRKGRAFIVRQFKTPEEIKLMRSIYGKLFVQISVFGSPQKREEYLVSKMKLKSKGTKNDLTARIDARDLIKKDSKEDLKYGQNIRDTFPMGDFFVDFSEREQANRAIERYMAVLFGSNEISPSRDEYGMYLAKTASLRSSDLSRQVGAAIFTENSEVISLGSNEVPKAGGGTYWPDSVPDARDFQMGFDPNELYKNEIFADLITRLNGDKLLSRELLALGDVLKVMDSLFHDSRNDRYKDARVMDIIEFGRIIHAEMSAICDAARNGISISRATMYVTTFPCHICAKHIVASGIKRVVYLEPYPKSYTNQLHSNSIQIDDHTDESKVHFEPFLGIAPYRYRDLFEKGKRKADGGAAVKWKSDPRRPIIDIVTPFYLSAEDYVVAQLGSLVLQIEEEERLTLRNNSTVSPDSNVIPAGIDGS